MNRQRRTEVLCHSALSSVLALANDITHMHAWQYVEAPTVGLMMIQMRDGAKLDAFYLGEVLVTSCKVDIAGFIGLGVVRGVDEARAQAMALVDAIYRGNLAGCDLISDQIATLDQVLSAQRRAVVANNEMTKVNFDTLDEEVKS